MRHTSLTYNREESRIMPDFGWRKTWEDSENDYLCYFGEEKVGRIYLNPMNRWEINYQHGRGGGTFHTDSRREAMMLLEDEFEHRQAGGEARGGSFWMGRAPA